MWFARGYDEYRTADRRWRNGEYDRIASGNTSGRGHSDPTANEALRRTASPYAWKIAAIEQAAAIAAPGYFRELLKNVTGDMTWEVIQPPCGRAQFYAARREFFLALHKIRENG